MSPPWMVAVSSSGSPVSMSAAYADVSHQPCRSGWPSAVRVMAELCAGVAGAWPAAGTGVASHRIPAARVAIAEPKHVLLMYKALWLEPAEALPAYGRVPNPNPGLTRRV